MAIIPKSVPVVLTALPQWVLYRYEDRGGPKPTKVPYTCQGYKASTTNPDHWSKFDYAVKIAARPGFCAGVGFVFTPDDPYCGIDLDNVWQSDADEGAEWAQGILKRFSDTYGEASPSDTGYKIWCRAKAPRCGKWLIDPMDPDVGAIEIYDHSRFFAVTGRSNRILTIADHQEDIDDLVANLDDGHRIERARTIPAIIHAGEGRHNVLLSLAGTMHRRGAPLEAIEAALLATNAKVCDPPYPPEHIHKIIKSTQKWSRA